MSVCICGLSILLVFRRYYLRLCTCGFRFVTLSARTISASVHAVSGLSRFPQVQFPLAYMRLPACHVFRTYYLRRDTCDFRFVTIFARTWYAEQRVDRM